MDHNLKYKIIQNYTQTYFIIFLMETYYEEIYYFLRFMLTPKYERRDFCTYVVD